MGISADLLRTYLKEPRWTDFRLHVKAAGVKLKREGKRWRPLTDDEVKKIIAHYRLRSRPRPARS